MRFIRFIENRYQEVKYESDCIELGGGYAPWKEQEIKTLYNVLNFYRAVIRFLLIPKVFFDFLCVNTGLMPEPRPVLVEKIREQKALEEKRLLEAEEAAKAKKVGWNKPKKAQPHSTQ